MKVLPDDWTVTKLFKSPDPTLNSWTKVLKLQLFKKKQSEYLLVKNIANNQNRIVKPVLNGQKNLEKSNA